MESNDCMMIVSTSNTLEIELESIVYSQFGEQIMKVIQDVLDEKGIKHIFIRCLDKGALDYTIRARLITALRRLEAI